ncbi:hypothetical protein JMF89_13810 [Clostridiaceae bacterium UIB06]|nr:hypothetical protein [Clostridiaceae bacterium UIB06]
MLIKDSEGKYELKVDLERCIVYEKNIGLWDNKDISRFHNDYLSKIIPLLKGREWFKCTDLCEYEFSNITDEITTHTTWCVKNNLFGAILIVKNEEVEMQMNLSVLNSGMIYSPITFSNYEEAEKWFTSHWI